MSSGVRIRSTTARYTSTKCAKSRNSKNRRSSSGSLGTVPGCLSASSDTMRGDAEPTWWTCSSALGSRAMKSESIRGSSQALLQLGDQVVREIVDGRPGLEDLAVEEDGRRALHSGLLRCGGGRRHPVRTLVVLDRGSYGVLVGTRLDGEVGELGALRERAGLVGLVLEEQVVELLGDLGRRLVQDDRECAGGPVGVALLAVAQEVERPVLDLHLAVVGELGQVVAGPLLELTAVGAEEVLVDDDLVGRVVRSDGHAELAARARRVGRDVRGVVEAAGDEEAHQHDQQDGADDATDHQVAPAALLALLLGQRRGSAGGPVGPAVLLRHQIPSD